MPRNRRAWLKRLLPILVLLTCALGPAPVPAAEPVLAKFKLIGHGELHLPVPAGWRAEFRRPLDDQPATIIFTPETGDDFKLVIHPLWDLVGIDGFNSEPRIRALLEKEIRELASSVKEAKIDIQAITGNGNQGFYFRATDKDPKPGEYEYLLRAGLGVGKLLLSVALVFHDQESPVVEETLALLRGASQK